MKEAFAARLNRIPPYLFKELDDLKATVRSGLIDLGEGSPDLSTPKPVLGALARALRNPENHRYPSYPGKLSVRTAVTKWYRRRFGVELDPEHEVAMLLGSKEGVAHLLWGTCDSGDVVGVCDPNYPVYPNQTRLAGASVVTIPLEEQNRFLPSLNWLTTMAPRLKLLCLNFPNNPTAAVAGLDFYSKVVELALRCGFYVVNDNVYSELYFGKHRPPSILEVPDAKTCSLEFHSLSKTFSMAGWRIGMAVGSRKLIQALLRMKQNTDSGPFGAIQDAAAFALAGATRLSAVARRTYQRRRDVFCRELTEAGWRVPVPEATFYVWAQVPQKASSDLETEGPRQAKSDVSSDRTAAEGGWRRAKSDVEFVKEMLRECRVMAAPGSGFGQYGRGYVRFALVADEKKLREAASRIGKWLRKRTV